MNIRKHDMSEWRANTRRWPDSLQAIGAAEYDVEQGRKVSIWPLGDQWMVITWTSALVN